MIIKEKQTKSISQRVLGCVTECHPVYPFVKQLSCKCSLQWVTGLGWDLWLLLHSQCWSHMGMPLRHPVAALCQGDPAALALPSCSYHRRSRVLVSSVCGFQLCLHRTARAASSRSYRVVSSSSSLEWLCGQFRFPWLLVLPRKKGLTSHRRVSALGSGKSLIYPAYPFFSSFNHVHLSSADRLWKAGIKFTQQQIHLIWCNAEAFYYIYSDIQTRLLFRLMQPLPAPSLRLLDP